MITINSKKLQAMLLLMAKKDVRIYLIGLAVQVSGGSAVLVSSDGAVMGAYEVEVAKGAGFKGDFIIPREVVEKAIKFASGAKDVVIHPDRLHAGGVDIHFTPVDGIYPPWRRMFVELPADGTPVELDGRYVEIIGKVTGLMSGDKYRRVCIQTHGPKLQCYFTTSDPAFAGVLMPLRTDEISKAGLPSFVRPLA